MINTVLNSVVSLFLIMLLGVYGRRKNIITIEINNGLIDILLNIALPIMIVSSFIFSFDESIKTNIIKAFIYSFTTYLVMIFVSYALVRPIKDEKRTIVHFANVFSNTGYIGFPVLNAIYGPEGVVYGSIFNMFFVIFVWTYGIMVYKGHMEKKELKEELIKALFNPSIIAVIIGIIIMVFEIQIPGLLLTSINSVGSITGPLSMIVVGAILARVKFIRLLKDWVIYYGLATKLVIIPLILYLISILIRDRSIVANSVIIIASMPSAIMTSILAENYNIEKDFAAVIVLISTLSSILTIPVLVKILM